MPRSCSLSGEGGTMSVSTIAAPPLRASNENAVSQIVQRRRRQIAGRSSTLSKTNGSSCERESAGFESPSTTAGRVELNRWHEIPCRDCDATVGEDETYTCGRCDETVCRNCSVSCESCSESLCSGCTERCERCEGRHCGGCLSPCVISSKSSKPARWASLVLRLTVLKRRRNT